MAQIQAGITYTDGAQVTASNLNAHVNNAVLVPGAISTQSAATTCTSSDGLLILQSGTLKQATVSQLPFINKDGSVAMTGELTLSSSTPVASLAAASKSYVDTGLATKQASIGYTPVNKAGDTMTGDLLLSSFTPVTALSAASKTYVDTKQTALGYTPVNKAGDTMTGILTLSAGPVNALDASTKQYVDTGLAGKISTGGATVTGDYLFSGKLQTSSVPTTANDVINKSYVDSLTSSIPTFAASAYFYTAVPPSPTVNPVTFLTVTASRTAGSSTLTVNYGSLNARYYDTAKPFFLQYQYVGLNLGVTGITGRLYQITSTNIGARTFTITTPETTAFSASVQLTLVYDSTNLATNQYGQNVKSIYIDMTAVSKYYVNYISDIISGSSAPVTPANTPIRCVNVCGNSNGYDVNQLIAIPMRDFGRTTYIYSQDVAEGFGANSLGCHIGFFYNNANGSDHYSQYAASFSILTVLP